MGDISTFLKFSRIRASRADRKAHKKRRREQARQKRELARNRQRRDAIASRLHTEQIDAQWVGEAMLIMEEYGYGLAQVRKKVVPILRSHIEQQLLEEKKQAASRLSTAIALQIEALKEQSSSIDPKDDDDGWNS